ncbi:MAG: hypothetical protein AAB726_03380 [Patescibacteria group bacterium]
MDNKSQGESSEVIYNVQVKLKFEYNKEKDAWCLLNKGKSSNNSSQPTKVYSELVSAYGDNPDEKSASVFIDQYLEKHNYNIPQYLQDCQRKFDSISSEFEKVAERIFGISLEKEITVYLTVNNRCPYSIEENWFFVSISQHSQIGTIMHELWHFYTWYKFGVSEEERLGAKKYNDVKEALTVLLNVECKHLLPEGMEDSGYPQHQKLREKILELYKQNIDVDYVWREAVQFIDI